MPKASQHTLVLAVLVQGPNTQRAEHITQGHTCRLLAQPGWASSCWPGVHRWVEALTPPAYCGQKYSGQPRTPAPGL